MKMENGINRLSNIGISSEMTTEQKGLLKLSNKIAWSVLLFCTFVGIIGLILSEYTTAIYDLTLVIVIFIPIVLNYYKMYTAAKFVLIFSGILAVVAGSLLYGYASVFKYMMILPISITFIFFSEESKWKLYFPMLFMILSLVFFEIDKFLNHNYISNNFNQNFSNEHVGHIFESMTFFLLIALYIMSQSYFRSILKKKESELIIYKNIFDNSQEGLSIIDTKGRYVKQNNAHEKILGFTDKELVSNTPAIHMGEELYNEIAETLEKTGKYKGEFISKTKFGEKHIDLIAFVIIENNKAQCIVGIQRDITERKITELALKESEAKLQESNKTKDKFFSIIAHDLKSPFNAILGFSDILMKNHKEYDDETREKMIGTVNRSAQNAFKLLENLLTWSHSQSGQINFSPEKLHLKILLFKTIGYLQTQAEKKDIKILDTISEKDIIFADKNMIATVLRNLISNAIKFTPKNGNIVISSERQADREFLEISVADTGVGIPKDKIDDLFRVDKDTSTKGTEDETGTGLGLILCKEFVEKHGGLIWVESTVGKGSAFKFTIPLHND